VGPRSRSCRKTARPAVTVAVSAAFSGGAISRGCWCDSATVSCSHCRGSGQICQWHRHRKSLKPTTVQQCCLHRWRCESWCVVFANCGSETMPVPLADVRSRRRACTLPAADRAVQRGTTRVRYWCPRRHARTARRDRHHSRHAWRRWCPLRTGKRSYAAFRCRVLIDRSCLAMTRSRGDRRRWRIRTRTSRATVLPTWIPPRRAGEAGEGLVPDGALRRSPVRDAGASLRPCDTWIVGSLATCRDARSYHSIGPRDERFVAHPSRSAVRDPRRWPARVRIHPVRPGGVPSGTRRGSGGAPA
jgi:hypothetical protein